MQKILFIVFLFIFLFTVLSSLLIVITVSLSPTLSAPMYFFLTYLALVDASFTSVTTPKLIVDLLFQRRTISWRGCMTQIFLEHFLAASEVIVLTAMAYDPYVAVCKPLHYTTITRQGLCQLLVVVAWIGGILHASVQILFTRDLTFCGPHVFDRFRCDFLSLLELACSDTYRLGVVVAANSGGMCLLIFCLLLVSCIAVLSSWSPGALKGGAERSLRVAPTLQWWCSSLSLCVHLHASCGHVPCGQVGGCVLCNPHTHVKPYYLHSEKHRGEKCHEESDEEESNLGYS